MSRFPMSMRKLQKRYPEAERWISARIFDKDTIVEVEGPIGETIVSMLTKAISAQKAVTDAVDRVSPRARSTK